MRMAGVSDSSATSSISTRVVSFSKPVMSTFSLFSGSSPSFLSEASLSPSLDSLDSPSVLFSVPSASV